MKTNILGNGTDLKFRVNKNFSCTNEKQNAHNVPKSPLLGRPADLIFYVLIAKSLMHYSEITLSALYLAESEATTN